MVTEKRLIDADALMAQLEDRQAFLVKGWGYRDHYTRGFEEAVDKVGNAPSVDAVEVVHGRWKNIDTREYLGWMCSNCQKWFDSRTNYCPHCGAKMDGGNEDGK